MSENDEAALSLGPLNLTGKGKAFVIGLILITFALVYILLFTEGYVSKQVARMNNPEVYDQFEKYKLQYALVEEVANAWNDIESIENIDSANVLKIRSSIDDATERYESLPIDKLGNGIKASWHLNLAKLYLIQYDIANDETYFYNAIKNANEARQIASNSKSLNKKEMEQFKQRPILDDINWVELAVYSLSVYYATKNDPSRLEKLNKLKSKMGGCDFFTRQMIRHRKMNKSLSCTNS